MKRSILFLLIPMLASPMAGAVLTLERRVVANGGGTQSSEDYALNATCGQAAIGTVSSASNSAQLGFWHAAGGSSAVPEDPAAAPTSFALAPGPAGRLGFVGGVAFAVPCRSQVEIRLYDVTGRSVLLLASGTYEAGWHQAPLASRGLASGVYFCRLTAEGWAGTRRFVLMK